MTLDIKEELLASSLFRFKSQKTIPPKYSCDSVENKPSVTPLRKQTYPFQLGSSLSRANRRQQALSDLLWVGALQCRRALSLKSERRRAVWWFVGRGVSRVSATAALWAAAAARWSEKRPITSALGKCSLVLSVT